MLRITASKKFQNRNSMIAFKENVPFKIRTRILSVSFYLLAILIACVSTSPILYWGFKFITIVAENDNHVETALQFIGLYGIPLITKLIFSGLWIFIAIGLIFSFCILKAGYHIERRENRIFCLVVSALVCFCFPIGTVLGLASVAILFQDPIKKSFV